MTALGVSRKRGQRSWTPEQKAAQSARARARKPWLKSTGPKTVQGKKKTSRNALKHGQWSAKTIEFKRYLRWQKAYLARAAAAFKRRRYLRRMLALCSKILQYYGKLSINKADNKSCVSMSKFFDFSHEQVNNLAKRTELSLRAKFRVPSLVVTAAIDFNAHGQSYYSFKISGIDPRSFIHSGVVATAKEEIRKERSWLNPTVEIINPPAL